MKKSLLLFAAALGFATVSYAQTSYGLKAGVTFPNVKFSQSGLSVSPSSSTSFYLTGYADVNIASNLSIQPGLSLQGKGYKISDEGETFKQDLMYLEVPVNFVYYVPAGSGNLFLGAGPYAAYGISSKTFFAGESESGSFDDAGLNAFDAGLNVLGGYKLANGFLINAGYGIGLTNMGKDSGDAKAKNRVFSVGIGFQF